VGGRKTDSTVALDDSYTKGKKRHETLGGVALRSSAGRNDRGCPFNGLFAWEVKAS